LAIDCCPARTYLHRECGSILAAMESLKEYAVPVSCEIRSKLDTDSDLNWTPIPEKVGQSFRF
jgi:hypothetical protein